MALPRTRRLTGLRLWRRLCVSLLLPLMLLLTQQAGWLHALGHEVNAAASHEERSDRQHMSGGVCDLCLGLAQLGSGALPAHVAPAVFTDTTYHWAAPLPAHTLATPAPPQRSRGPPSAA